MTSSSTAICELCKQELTCPHKSRRGNTCGLPLPMLCNSGHPHIKCCCQHCYSNLRTKAWWYHKQASRLTDEEMQLNRLIASQEVNLRTLINKNQSLTSAIKNSTQENEFLKSALKSLEERIQFLTTWDSVPGYDTSGDVTLYTPDGGCFLAHRSILSGRSMVFKAMLNSGMKESRSMEVQLHDVNKEAVSIFLKFMYKGEVDAKDFEEDVEKKSEMIVRLCQQYQIDFLLSTFQTFIVDNVISFENLDSMITMADMYQLDVVKTAIKDSTRWSIQKLSFPN
ncbi:hypothetical protein KI387_003538 [Taxus chinensis]|uniref:BTB domain-containing protein n=1 Tax=Taxus chinensis TaxID=29808 RepID=A0AA38F8Q7_TAXCH|nr:hypothetical protein KI387_041680 [Taxus chinensis]KAH9331430.1 hypothetical protein KI387_003538 [Taxus chinensis]